ncbi:MAG: BlaI/MecI/CopY family transcriptional regulator [Acidimicrobiales bacterium]
MARLGQLERRVMDVLWSSPAGGLTVREVGAQLPDHAYTTVLTVLDRLHRKDVVRRTRDGRAHRYTPVASREAYTAELMHEALGTSPDRGAVLVRLAETVDPADAAALRQALGDLDRMSPAGRGR